MASQTIYRSPNGDDWELERDADGGFTVVHRANAASGGRITRSTPDEFLQRNGGSPEAQALRELMRRAGN